MHLDSVTNDATATVLTGRGQRRNRAFKAIEDMSFPTHDDLKSLIVVVMTPFTLCHLPFLLIARVCLSHAVQWILIARCLPVHLSLGMERRKSYPLTTVAHETFLVVQPTERDV